MEYFYYFISQFSAVIGFGVGITLLLNSFWIIWGNKRSEKTETIEDRVNRLTSSLKEAISLINNIEGEINARSSLAKQLQEDAERYNKLIELKKPEVEAIAQVLRGELSKEGNRSFWKAFAVNFLFFLLGAGASWGINLITK